MTPSEKLEKAARIKAKLISKNGMDADFADAMSLHMVMSENYKISENRMAVWLAGPKGADTFRAKISGNSVTA